MQVEPMLEPHPDQHGPLQPPPPQPELDPV